MTHMGRRFGLSDERGSGVRCGDDGVFVGEVPLLEYGSAGSDSNQWQPRAIFDLNRELSKLYDVPVEFAGKSVGLATVARALNRGDLFHA